MFERFSPFYPKPLDLVHLMPFPRELQEGHPGLLEDDEGTACQGVLTAFD